MQFHELPNREEIELINAIYPVSRETLALLQQYGRRLLQWQKKTNLVSSSTLERYWSRHVADSLQCVRLYPDCKNWIDLGSGGGFPGLVIAIALRDVGSFHRLVESNQKKCAFLREIVREIGLPAEICCQRIESFSQHLPDRFEQPTIVTARALAPLKKLLDLTKPILQRGGMALFHKGREYRQELEECNGLSDYDLVIHKSQVLQDSVLIEIQFSNVQGLIQTIGK
jgi:16S rRNA (guanine527-N7)-methyltransferase